MVSNFNLKGKEMDANLKKQLIDQSAHFGVGVVLVVIFSFVFSVVTSCVLVALVAYVREVAQRVSNGDPWYECKGGCKLDLLFWGLGIVVGFFVAGW